MTQVTHKAPVCTDCRSSRHQDCTGRTLDHDQRVVDCICPPAFGHPPRTRTQQEDAA